MTPLAARLSAAIAAAGQPSSDFDLDRAAAAQADRPPHDQQAADARPAASANLPRAAGGAALTRSASSAPALALSSASPSATAPDAAPHPPQQRPAGVLIAIHEDDARIILTKRASGLRHHPGQIALPGGKVDPGDDGPVAAALRESHEEVGLPPAMVTILGTLPAHRTVTGFSITPVVGLISGPFRPIPEAGEVEEVFAVPLSHLADPARYRVEGRIWRGTRRSYYVVPYGPYYIWGATARILHGLAIGLSR